MGTFSRAGDEPFSSRGLWFYLFSLSLSPLACLSLNFVCYLSISILALSPLACQSHFVYFLLSCLFPSSRKSVSLCLFSLYFSLSFSTSSTSLSLFLSFLLLPYFLSRRLFLFVFIIFFYPTVL